MPESPETARALDLSLSQTLADQLSALIPGGVNSPFRSFHEVGGCEVFLSRASGAYLWDVDGNRYIDFLGAWGPAILGHAPPQVVAACQKAIAQGAVFGAPHVLELALSTELIDRVPSLEKVRFVNSGTEAVMSAVRLARGFTGRDLLLMFEGGYHGHCDAALASRSHSASAGIPTSVASNTLVVPYNDAPALAAALDLYGEQVAAVLIEPVAGSMGVVPPEPGYLDTVRELCTRHGALLVFDEVLTGLRVAPGGAQELYGVRPDLTCFGKALGGGMPIGAYGGAAAIMDRLSPSGDVYQAGTFSGNPVTMAGGIETLRLLKDRAVYDRLERLSMRLFSGLGAFVQERGLPVRLQRVGSMFAILFCPEPVRNYREHLAIDGRAFARFFHYLLERGVYMPPSAVDAACISAAHSEKDIDRALAVAVEALAAIF